MLFIVLVSGPDICSSFAVRTSDPLHAFPCSWGGGWGGGYGGGYGWGGGWGGGWRHHGWWGK